MNKLILILLVLAACGKPPELPEIPVASDSPEAPVSPASTDVSETPVVSATPTPAPTAVPLTIVEITSTSADPHTNQICIALRNFDPLTQILRFPITINSTTKYSFESDGVYRITIGGVKTVAPNVTSSNGFCTYVISGGQFISVTP